MAECYRLASQVRALPNLLLNQKVGLKAIDRRLGHESYYYDFDKVL
jgi:hypothetical protein